MNSRALRRLAADHGALHSQPLPPNYLFPPTGADSDDLTQLDILLAGPTHTPFSAGLYKLHLNIPPTYPQQPPTAHFRTPIFHPNVDPQTGAVCVETLKRDWDAKLTLRDILVVIGCLLIQPNPDSALNAEAGGLIQDDYEAYVRRAELMTSIHAAVPKALRDAVREAQNRGQIVEEEEEVEKKVEVKDFAADAEPAAPPRRRRLGMTARQRGTAAVSRRSDGSPSGVPSRREQHQPPAIQPFVLQSNDDDVFGEAPPARQSRETPKSQNDDSSMVDADQENDEARSPVKTHTPKAATPRRPQGPPVPLGELTMDEPSFDESSSDLESEYPPSPRKSPSKKQHQQHQQAEVPPRPESSRDATSRAAAAAAAAPNLTPPNLFSKPLAKDSPLLLTIADETPSPRKIRIQRPFTPSTSKPSLSGKGLFGFSTPKHNTTKGVFKTRSPSSSEKKRQEVRRREELDARLWRLCGRDVGRWNRGEFRGDPLRVKGGRW